VREKLSFGSYIIFVWIGVLMIPIWPFLFADLYRNGGLFTLWDEIRTVSQGMGR